MEVEHQDVEPNPGAPILGQDSQLLIDLNQKLSTLGIRDTIKLPTIVVTGDQSCGKSSLVEAISKVSVPKASGLCTRCPISLSLSNGRASGWECSVYVEEQYTFEKTARQKKVSKANPLGPWKALEKSQVTLVETTREPKKLIDLIERAQDIILNPLGKQDSSNSSANSEREGFSPNIIRVELAVPDCAPLHFIDLPGVIASSGKGQPDYYVELVKSLATIYAKDEDNFLLLTLPTNHDVSNSNSYGIIQKHSAQSRTMAVFTKIDICRVEERDDLLRKYFGEGGEAEEEEFEYGNHVVMLRDAAGSAEGVREAEQIFFSEAPWASLRSATQKCLGVGNLGDRIRDILFKKTADALPGNLANIRARIAELQDELKEMPEPNTTELPYDLRSHMERFEKGMEKLFSQARDGPSPRSALIKCMQGFYTEVQESRPTIRIKTSAEDKQQTKALEVLRGPPGSGAGGVDHSADDMSRTKSEVSSGHATNADSGAPHSFRLEKVRQINRDHYSSSIPGDIELKAVTELHRLSVKPWKYLFTNFLQKVAHVIKLQILQNVQKAFRPIRHLPAYDEIYAITNDYLDHLISEESDRLYNLCASERSHPLTFDDSRMRTAEVTSLDYLRRRRETARLEVEKDIRKANAILKKKYKEPTPADIGLDEYDLEIQMCAKARAYFEVASHRFVDTICLNIHAQLIPKCEENLAKHVKVALGLDNIAENRDKLVELMTEDMAREALRRGKVNELERLQKGCAYLENVRDILRRPSGGIPQFNDEGTNAFYYQNLHDDPFALRTNISPNKRKADSVDFDDQMDDFSTPIKRQRESTVQRPCQNTGESSRCRAYLPSRTRSVDPDE